MAKLNMGKLVKIGAAAVVGDLIFDWLVRTDVPGDETGFIDGGPMLDPVLRGASVALTLAVLDEVI